MEVWTLWHANYWLSGMVKAVTALASVPTAILLVQLVPKAIALPRPDELARSNRELAASNAALRQSEERYRLLFDSNPNPLWVYETKTLAFLDVNQSATRNYGYSRFRLIVSNIKDYAIIGLDPEGRVTSWNGGAQRIKGYRTEEILSKHLSVFYLPEDIAIGKPTNELDAAREQGRFEDDGWRVRKDGSRFWANVVVTPLRDDGGSLRGFVKITRDVTERRKAEQEIVRRSVELEAANRELEAFSYSVSHDLRAPLRGIEGFSQALQEDYQEKLDATARDYLGRIRSGTLRMAELIDDLLNLSRVTRAEMYREPINLSKLANEVAQELQSREPERKVALKIAPGLEAVGDNRLIRVALENLIGNAWKFTSRRAQAEIEFGVGTSNSGQAYFVRDNGAGFDQAFASRLFGPFQRLHASAEFPGSGIGLATVQRIIHRHGGPVWAEGFVDRGATVYFTLGRGNS